MKEPHTVDEMVQHLLDGVSLGKMFLETVDRPDLMTEMETIEIRVRDVSDRLFQDLARAKDAGQSMVSGIQSLMDFSQVRKDLAAALKRNMTLMQP